LITVRGGVVTVRTSARGSAVPCMALRGLKKQTVAAGLDFEKKVLL
jgi:hypothetical protein